ncbi:MAG: hypothetical protein IJ385_04740 [Ruminiclostridium sp.]|nr:hypothetical protein [Ruminiclostridium sp.]
MEKKCPECGSAEIINGALISTAGVVFVPEEEKGKFIMKSSGVSAGACRTCGAVLGLRLTDSPKKLTD